MLPKSEPQSHANVAIEALYQSHQRQLLAHLARLVHDPSAAEDLCQETFLKALRSWDQQAQITNASAWLYRIATNTAYDYLRRHQRIRFAPLDEASAPAHGTDSMEVRLHEQEPVQRVLTLLPDQSRHLLLYASAGHSTRELAAALDCSDTAVRLRLFRARARFRQLYHSIGEEYAEVVH